jgi:YggT family protein
MASIATVVNALIRFYEILVVVWCVLSWFPMGSGSLITDVRQVIDRIVGPFMHIFQRFIPPLGGIDLSPVVAIFLLDCVRGLLVSILL